MKIMTLNEKKITHRAHTIIAQYAQSSFRFHVIWREKKNSSNARTCLVILFQCDCLVFFCCCRCDSLRMCVCVCTFALTYSFMNGRVMTNSKRVSWNPTRYYSWYRRCHIRPLIDVVFVVNLSIYCVTIHIKTYTISI